MITQGPVQRIAAALAVAAIGSAVLLGIDGRPAPSAVRSGVQLRQASFLESAERTRVDDASLHHAPGIDKGEALIGELNCIACHSADEQTADRLMPRHAPHLGLVGRRLSAEYLDAFLRDPQGVRPGTAMPNIFSNLPPEMLERVIEPLVHFLASQGGPFMADRDAPADLDAAQGRFLYHEVGCVACHAPFESADVLQRDRFPKRTDDDPYATEDDRQPDLTVPQIGMALVGIGSRTSLASLKAFLLDPTSMHPSGRMPDMNLTRDQAHLIASYLISKTGPTDAPVSLFTIDPEKAQRGETFFAAMGCAHCHQDMGPNRTPIPPMPRPEPIPPLSALKSGRDTGCLAPDPESGLADYDLTETQRDSIADVLDHVETLALPPTDEQRIARFLTAGSCLACHERDGVGGPAEPLRDYFVTLDEADLGDEGRIPPPLTGVGAKLRPEWLMRVMTQGTKIRPYMAEHMPRFELEGTRRFVGALERVDAPRPIDQLAPDTFSETLRKDGRTLFGLGGMACINCHAIAGHDPIGEPAMDLVDAHERLRPDWYKAYMRDPSKFHPGTRMPNHWPPGAPNPFPMIQDGDPDRQVDAIWAYLSLGQFLALPEGVTTGQGFELVVVNEPMVFRTFIQGTGARAIAIGFPEQVHAAFDAHLCRMDLIWRGRFLSASGAWAGRGGNPTDPLGEDVIQLPPGPPIVSLPRDDAHWPDEVPADTAYQFKGYTLDDARRPTLHYTYGPTRIDEALRPVVQADAPGMQRVLTLANPPAPDERLFYRAAVGKSIEQTGQGRYRIDDRIDVLIDAPPQCDIRMRSQGRFEELMIALRSDEGDGAPLTVSATFSW